MDLLGDLVFKSSLDDSVTGSELFGARRVKTVKIGDAVFVYVASPFDAGIQIAQLGPDGTLTRIASVNDSFSIGLDFVDGLQIMAVGSTLFLVAAGGADDALTVFRIQTDGRLLLQSVVPNPAANLLDGVWSIAQANVAGKSFVISAGQQSDALAVWQLGADGSLTLTGSVSKATHPSYLLDSVYRVTTVTVGAKTFVVAATESGDSAISVYELTAAGGLLLTSQNQVANLAARGLHGVQIDGAAWVLAGSGFNNGSLMGWQVLADGSLMLQAVFADPALFGRFTDITTTMIDGVPFVLASDFNTGRIGVFSLSATDGFTLVQSLANPAVMAGASGLTVAESGGRLFVLVASQSSSTVSSIEIGGGDDAIVGTMGDDRVVGLGGDDDIMLKAGNDLAYGGAGDDVISGRAGRDTLFGGDGADLLIGGAGNDVLEGGAGADTLIGGLNIDTAAYGASPGAVRVDLAAGTAAGAHASGDILLQITHLTGSRFGDRLGGDGQANLLRGAGGNDTLLGQDGDDTLEGGLGQDMMYGGAGADRLIGGAGNDTLSGGAGADVFVLATRSGADTVTDFAPGVDTLDLRATAVTSFAQLQGLMALVPGGTLITIGSDSVLLQGVLPGALQAGDVLF